MMYNVKGNPASMKFLHALLDEIHKSDHYTNFDFDTLLECRDNIYMYVDDHSAINPTGYMPNKLYAAILCRRINASEIEDEELKYHCQPYRIVYSVDCLYHHNPADTVEFNELSRRLININGVTKNDSFILIRLPSEYADILNDTLISMGCYLSNVVKDGIITFIKPPILNGI